MPTTLTPVANGFFQIANVNGVYTRTAPANPAVKEATGDDDIVTCIAFDISGLAGKTVTDIRLSFGINSLVAGTGNEDLRVMGAQVNGVSEDNDSWFENIHSEVADFRFTSVTDSVGAFSLELLLGEAIRDIQTWIDGGFSTWCLGFTFSSGSSALEHITISANPTLSVTTTDEIDDDGRDLYWVLLAGGDWDADPTLKWSASSGGLPGEDEPTILDNVFFDANSGIGTIACPNIDPGQICRNLDTTGFGGTFQPENGCLLEVTGDLFIGATTTFDFDGHIRVSGDVEYHASATLAAAGGGRLDFNGVTGTEQYFRPNGHTVDTQFNFYGGSITHMTEDVLSAVATKVLHMNQGFLYTHGFNIRIGAISYTANSPLVRGMILEDSHIEGTAGAFAHGWNGTNSENFTIDAGTSTIEMTHTSAAYAKEFTGGGVVFYNLLLSGDSSATGGAGERNADFIINDSNTFNDIDCDASAGAGVTIISFEAGRTTSANTISVAGTAGNEIVLISTVAGANWGLQKRGGGFLELDYVDISDCHPPLGTLVYCTNSIDGGGNNERVIFAQEGSISVSQSMNRAQMGARTRTRTAWQRFGKL